MGALGCARMCCRRSCSLDDGRAVALGPEFIDWGGRHVYLAPTVRWEALPEGWGEWQWVWSPDPGRGLVSLGG